MTESLQILAKSYFSTSTRASGYRYYRQKRVSFVSVDPLHVEASVRGSYPYDVDIIISDTGDDCSVTGECTCPYFHNVGECKHIWATIVALDEKHSLSIPPYARYVASVSKNESREMVAVPTSSTGGGARTVPSMTWKKALKEMDPINDTIARMSQSTDHSSQPDARLHVSIVLNKYEQEFLTIRAEVAVQLKSGEWGKPKPLKAGSVPTGLSAEDFTLATSLLGSTASRYSYYGQHQLLLNQVAALRLLPQLCARGNLMLYIDLHKWGPLKWIGDAPLSFEMSLVSRDEDSGYQLEGYLRQGDEVRDVSTVLDVTRKGWVLWPDAIGRMDDPNAARWLDWYRQQRTLVIPAEELEAFTAALLKRDHLPPIRLPEAVRLREIRGEPVPELNIHKSANPASKSIGTSISFLYEDASVRGTNTRSRIAMAEKRALVYRSLQSEKRYMDRLKELGAIYRHSYLEEDPYLFVPSVSVAGLVRQLIEEGWSVVAEGRPFRQNNSFSVSVSSGVDWFDVHAQFDYGGATVELPALLDAARRKQGWVTLSDGSVGILPEEWLRKYAGIAALGESVDGAMRFKMNQAFILDSWLAELPNVRLDEIYRRTRDKIAEGNRVEAVLPPKSFVGTLRPYQQEGLGWLQFLATMEFGGCLADDMGLGKTVQVLAMLEARRVESKKANHRPSLVVVPRSLMFNWKREAAQFCPKLRMLDHTGVDRGFDKGWDKKHDVVLTTYGTLRQDIEALKAIEFDYVILDESQAIKNATAQTAKCVRLLRGRHRLAMSGTPVENHLGELWSLFEFLNPGLLGASSVFERATREPSPEQRTLLARALRPFILRRTKAQVAKDLPDRQEDTLYCELPAQQRQHYNNLREYYRHALLAKVEKGGLNKAKIIVLEALLRLRQAACHPGLIDPDFAAADCAKFNTLMLQLQELVEEGHKALVFSQFTSFLALLKTRLDNVGLKYEYLDGKTRNRQECVDRFQSDAGAPLFLISLKAGGLGLNLTSADYVFLLDPWWNPAVEAQAIDRAHRIGQTQKVLAYRLIAKDTVEEKVLALQESKRELANAILNEDNSILRNLTREDLEFLLG